jgi:hypothetical protein
MPKAFSSIAALLASGVAIGNCLSAQGQSYPKLKEIQPCPPLLRAAATNHISTTGTDPLRNTNILQVGDSATLLVTLVLHTNRSQWLLFVQAATSGPKNTPPKEPKPFVIKAAGGPISFPSKPVPAALCMLGPFSMGDNLVAKSEKKENTFLLNEGFLGIGLDQAAHITWERNAATNSASKTNFNYNFTPAEKRALIGAFPTLMSYFEIIQHTEGLEDILRKVIDSPSLWSVVRHGGVNAGLFFAHEAYPANPADWHLPASTPVYYLPIELRINDKTALKVTLVVTAPRPPLLICGGIIGILAEKPSDDTTYLTLRVISAHSQPQTEIGDKK